VKPADPNDPQFLRRLEPNDPLLQPPSGIAPPIADPKIQTLNFRDLAWPDFQKLAVSIARDVDGHREAYEYGTPGQAQHGLDVLGENDRGEVHAYQARNVEKFTEKDLRKAVKDFADGNRPRNPVRFVVVVGCGTDRTQLLDELTELRDTYAGDFSIDLYGEARLSDMLRIQPEIVQRFFGTATAERFCVGALPLPTAQPDQSAERGSTQIADAVMRGPIEALNLNSQLAKADRLSETKPSDAPREYLSIAEKLSDGNWPGHALMMKRRAAEALAGSGEVRAAARLLSQLFWTYLDQGADHETQTLRHELGKLSQDEPDDEELSALVQTASAAHNAAADPLDRLDDLSEAVDALSDDSDFESEALVLLCELALTSEQHELIVTRADRLRDVARRAQSVPDRPSLGTRLRLCLADATGDWEDLLSDVRKRILGPWDIALALGRRGRYLAWHNEPDLARDAFSQAIERGVLLNANDDAGEWIHSTGYLDIRYGPITDLMDEAHRKIQALNAAGSEQRTFRHLTNPRERVLAYLHEEKYPAASDAGRRYLRECVVAGHWGSEFEAHTLLGDLFAKTGEPEIAARHYIRASAQKKLEMLLRDGPYVDVRRELLRLAPWERAATYRAIVSEADLVPDDHVDEIVAAALADAQAVTDGQVRQSGSAPELWASAIAGLGALVERASEDLASETLQLLAPLVERKAGEYRFTDDDHMRALAGIFQGHEGHAEDALEQIGRALEIEGPLSDTALKVAGELLASEEASLPLLEDMADRGNEHACLILAARGVASREVLQQAEDAFNRLQERPPPKAGTVVFGSGLSQDAQRIGVLSVDKRDTAANRLIQIAEDTRESDRNRADALQAISLLGGELSRDARIELFSRAMRFATGEASGSDLSPDLRQKPHPLSRFRFDLSPGPLEAYGLEAAAPLAQTQAETNEVIELALSMLASDDTDTTHRIAALLSRLRGDRLTASQAVLAGQPNPSLRALAAVLWVHDANRDVNLGTQLASDSNVLVRRTLAHEIASSGEIRPDSALATRLSADDHYSVRKALQDPEH